ncbi:unnamed protein product [Cylindrotheca closterium]|uniref:SAM-dependent MTase RsmB/NOP-type domain-containing protein n=1 Tax=Cylindrotheca closterium TaxID=2856 RepID=A0AAD2GDU6_9STRA|nr:unnamed protein product [Cylindrotheca closterium]
MRHHTVIACLVQLSSLTLGFCPNYTPRRNDPHYGLSPDLLSLQPRLPTVVKVQASSDVFSSTSKKEAASLANPSARSVAVFSLMDSLGKKNRSFAVQHLENDPDYQRLEKRDKAFARLLFSTVERRQGQIDKVVSSFTRSNKSQKIKAADRLCRSAISIGAAQILFLGVAEHAAIHDTVEVLRMHPKIKISKPQINFVNAILRNVQRKGMVELETNTTIYDNIEPWLAKEWIETYGEEKAKVIAEASMGQSPIFISVKRDSQSNEAQHEEKLKRIRDCFSTAGGGDEATILPHGSIEIPKHQNFGGVSQWPLYKDGEWWVQDPSASLPAIALHNALCKLEDNQQKKEAMHIVDLCSAPGGKTSQLCSFGFGKVTAIEVSKKRIRPLQENMARLKMEEKCEIVVADGREWIPSDDSNPVYGVLADVPCSATGVGSRRPDVLRKQADVLEELLTTQRELAVHAADDILAVGGTMVYATCSLLKQESEDQVKWLLSRQDGAVMETDPIMRGEIPGFDDAIDENGWLRVLPGILSGSLKYCDGFFVARLKRIR